jgi:hypothetical protein
VDREQQDSLHVESVENGDRAAPHWQVYEVELAAAVDTIPENALVAVGYIRIKIGDPRHAAAVSITSSVRELH